MSRLKTFARSHSTDHFRYKIEDRQTSRNELLGSHSKHLFRAFS